MKKPRLKVYRQLWAGPHLWIKLEDGSRIKFDTSDDAREYARENGFSKRLRIVFGTWPGKPEKGHTVDASFWEGPLPNRGAGAYYSIVKEPVNDKSADSKGRGRGDSRMDGRFRKQRGRKGASGQPAVDADEG